MLAIEKFCEKIFKYFNNPSGEVIDGYEDIFDEDVFDSEDEADPVDDVTYIDQEDDDSYEDDFFFDDFYWDDYDYVDDDEYYDDDPEDDYDDYDYDEDDDPELELRLLKYEERTTRQAADETYYGFMVQCSWRGLNNHDVREYQDDLYHTIMDEAS